VGHAGDEEGDGTETHDGDPEGVHGANVSPAALPGKGVTMRSRRLEST
jgi:hypothetical protein